MKEPTLGDLANLIRGMDRRFDGIDNQLDELSERTVNMAHNFNRRINAVDGKLDAIFDVVSDRFEDHEGRIIRLERNRV